MRDRPEQTAKIHGAERALSQGFRIIPVHHMTAKGCSCGDTCKPDSRGKHPRGKGWQRRASSDRAQFAVWQAAHPGCNWGAAAGPESDLFVFDLDLGEDGDRLGERTWSERYGPLPDTFTVRTGSGAIQLYARFPDRRTPDGKPLGNSAKTALGPGIDTRGDGGQVVLPGSVSWKGEYSVLRDLPVLNGEDDPALAAAFAAIYAAHERTAASRSRVVSTVPVRPASRDGIPIRDPWLATGAAKMLDKFGQLTRTGSGRSNLLSGYAKRLAEFVTVADGDIDEGWVERVLLDAAHENGFVEAHGLDYAGRQVRSGLDSGRGGTPSGWTEREQRPARADPTRRREPGTRDRPRASQQVRGDQWPKRMRDDLGNRDRLIDHHGDEIRYLADAEIWALFDGKGWTTDGWKAGILGRAQKTAESLPRTEAIGFSDRTGALDPEEPVPASAAVLASTSPRERFNRWAVGLRYHPKLSAMITSATAAPSLRAERSDFDRQWYLITVGNGVLDVRTSELTAHDPGLFLLRRTDVPFDPDAHRTRWLRLLATLQPDEAMRAYLARVFGYTLTGRVTERAVFCHWGEAQAERRAVMRIVKAALGQYAQTVPRAAITVARAGRTQIPADVARMAGVRMLAPEIVPDGLLDQTMVLALADGDDASARDLREKFADFTPGGKVHMAARFMPTAEHGITLGPYLQGIEWAHQAGSASALADLTDAIIADELPGVLAWIVEGCTDWLANGLSVPQAAQDATDQAVFHDDPRAQFLALRTKAAGPSEWTTVAELFSAWTAYATTTNVRDPGASNAFSRYLGTLGYSRGRENSGDRRPIVYGLTLRQGTEEEDFCNEPVEWEAE